MKLSNRILWYPLIMVMFLIITISCKKKDDGVNLEKESKQVEVNIIATVGGTLTTSDLIQLVIPPNALPSDGKVFVGRTGNEPSSVPNTDLEIVGDPITIRIPSDSIVKPLQLTFPVPSTSINTDNYCMFLYNGTTYFPVEYTINENIVSVSIDIINWEETNNKKSLILSSIILIAVKNKSTPPTSEMGLKEVTIISGKMAFSDAQAVNSSSKVVLFIHGIFSGPSNCWATLIPKVQKETNPSYTNYWTFGYNSALSINQNAEILANLLTNNAKGAQIDIVAHSMGGLVSRSMIEKYEGSKFIRKLVTLDTPHEGSPLAVFRYVVGAIVALDSDIGNYLIFNYNSKGCRDLNTYSAFIQQMSNLQNPPLPYYTIAATNDPSKWWKSGSSLILGDDDGVVSVVSAKGVQGAISPNEIVNIPVPLAHLEVTENDQIYKQVINYLKEPSGNEIIFNSNLTYGTVTDIDGNVYKTIKIGTQTWMAENLKTTKYRNGDPIPNIIDATAWAALSTGAYCWYNNDATTYKATYGGLYNWYAAIDSRNIAPAGWHVPTDAEWTTLTTFLGGEVVASGKLKETGTSHWLIPNYGATNATGFTALPGGYRDYNSDGKFYNVVSYVNWWSSTAGDATQAWTRDLFYSSPDVNRYFTNKQYGFSVRCVRD